MHQKRISLMDEVLVHQIILRAHRIREFTNFHKYLSVHQQTGQSSHTEN